MYTAASDEEITASIQTPSAKRAKQWNAYASASLGTA